MFAVPLKNENQMFPLHLNIAVEFVEKCNIKKFPKYISCVIMIIFILTNF